MRNLTKRHRSSVWRRCRALFIVAALRRFDMARSRGGHGGEHR